MHRRGAHNLVGVSAALACALGLLGTASCGADAKSCGTVVKTLRPGTSAPYSLHVSDGQIEPIVTEHN